MKNSVLFALTAVLLLGALMSGCLGQSKNNVECSTTGDCAGLLHMACVGQWGCPGGKCVWECEVTPTAVSSTVITTTTVSQPKAECSVDADCARGGCSGEICASKETAGRVISICLMRPEYECLKLTSCGCVGGRCMFKQTPEFTSCWSKASNRTAIVV